MGLASARARVGASLLSPCVVTRAGVRLALTMPDGSPLHCRIGLDKESPAPYANALEQQRRWKLVFPYGTDIRMGDVVLAGGATYSVTQVATGTSYSAATNTYAYMVTDANGAGVFLRKTATATVSRGGVDLLGLVDAIVLPQGPDNLSPEGGVISTTVVLKPLPAGVALKTGDIMAFHTLGGHSMVGQVPKKNILFASPESTDDAFTWLAVVRVYLEGILQ